MANNKGNSDDWFNFGSSQNESSKDFNYEFDKDSGWGFTEQHEVKTDDSSFSDAEFWGSTGSKPPDNKRNFISKFKSFSKRTKIIVVASTVIAFGGIITTSIIVAGNKELPLEQTSVYELQNVNEDIRSANIENLNKYIETSYLAKEWEYFNEIEIREQFYQKVLSSVEFDFEGKGNTLSTSVPVKVTHIDWVKVTNDMRDFDFKLIQTMYKDAGIKKTNYEFHKELTNLFSSYIVNLEELPVTETEVTLDMNYTKSKDGTYSWNLVDDSPLDKLLFSSEEFHTTLDVFGGIATGDIGTLEVNPNYTSWQKTYTNLEKQLEQEKKNFENFNKVVTNDNGTVLHINENGQIEDVINLNGDKTSKDENESEAKENSSDSNKNETKSSVDKARESLDKSPTRGNETSENKDGTAENRNEAETYEIKAPVTENADLNIVNAIINQLNVMKSNEPLHTYIKPKSKEPLPEGELIPYKWVGAYYLQHEYMEGDKQVVVIPEVGDGTFERPLGFDTPVVTKMIGADGKYHDVRVTLKKVFKGQDAIDYAVSFDERNRGFDISSDRSLMAIEFEVENLEGKEMSLQSEFTLSDADVNLVSRTGTMYNFKEKATIKPKQTVVMQDWFYTPNLEDSYLVWGKSFQRKIPEMWFRQLMLEPDEETEETNE